VLENDLIVTSDYIYSVVGKQDQLVNSNGFEPRGGGALERGVGGGHPQSTVVEVVN
jgi:hypothetical protein